MTIIYEKFYPVGYTPVKLCKLIYSYALDAAEFEDVIKEELEMLVRIYIHGYIWMRQMV